MSKLDVARILYGTQIESGPSVGKPVASTSVRYGTVASVNDDGTITVTLEDTGETVTLRTDTPVSVGDRVSIVVSNGSYIVYSLAETGRQIGTVRKDLSQQIKDEGDRILDEVNGEMDAWKADHQLTDADITSSIEQTKTDVTATFEGQLESLEDDVKTTYATKTEVSAGIDGLRTEVSEKYATTEGVSNEISTAIEQSSSQISQTVEQNVMNAVGETYATKTQLTQTSDEIRGIANGALSTANAANGTAGSALEKAEEVEAYFTFDVTGLKVGKTGQSAAVKMASDGSFKVLNSASEVLKVDSYNGYARLQSPTNGKVEILTENDSAASFGGGGYSFSSYSHGFKVNNVSAVELFSMTPSSQTGSGSVFDKTYVANMSFAVIYYTCTFNNAVSSVKFPITKGGTVGVVLNAMCDGADNLIFIMEYVTITCSSGNQVTLSITRGPARRASVKNNNVCSFNDDPGTQFKITKVTICG